MRQGGIGGMALKGYLELVYRVIQDGSFRRDRTGVGTYSLFGTQTRYSVRYDRFPLVTTKRVNFGAVVKELFWFLRGETNIATLGCGIWDEWADERGELGPIYGYQWRNWGGDQFREVVDRLVSDPFSRRHIVSAWNVADVPRMALPPCHVMFQFYVSERPTGSKRLDLQLYQRSADLALGVPFNIASYSLLLLLVARHCGYEPGTFIHTIGDAHVYLSHEEGLCEQLSREPLERPSIEVDDSFHLFDNPDPSLIRLVGYKPHPAIKFEVAV